MPLLFRTGPVTFALWLLVGLAKVTVADVIVSNIPGHEAEITVDVNPTDPQNLVIAAHGPIDENSNIFTLNTFYSMDGGQTWTRVSLGDAQDGLTSTRRFDPSVAFDEDGNVYVAYLLKLAGGQTALMVTKSVNGGQTYNQFTVVDTNGDIGNAVGNDKCHLATGRDPFVPFQQNVYVAWTRLVPAIPFFNQTVVVSGSTDGGVSFSAPEIINDASLTGISPSNAFPDPAVGPNGEVYVVWHQLDGDQVLVDVSFDGGANWGSDHLVTTSDTGLKTQIPAAPDRGVFVGPTLDVDRSPSSFNGRLYVTYTDVAAGGLPDIDIFVRHSDNHGQNWSAPVRVNDDFGGNKSQFLPWLDVDQVSGVVTVVWYDARNDAANEKVEVFLAASLNGGDFFFDNIKVSSGASDESNSNPTGTIHDYLEYIGVVAHGCRAHVVWADNSQDLSDMDFFTDLVLLPVTPLGIGCPTDATVECTQTGGTPVGDPAITAFLLSVNAIGGCGPVDVTHNAPAFFPLGETAVTFTATDGAGSTAQCSADLTVEDTTPPVISCPRDVTVEATDFCGTPADDPQLDSFFAQASAFDVCDPTVDITNDAPVCFPIGKTTVTFCATDDDGNQACCMADVVVVEEGGDTKISDTSGGFNGILADGDRFGSGVASIGDLDGDDVVDAAVGARGDDDGGVDRGAVWVLFLNSDGTVKTHQKISASDGSFAGALNDGDGFGRSVTSLGDLDGDSIVDLAVGAHLDDDGGPDRGAVWILFLNSDGTVKTHQKISASDGSFAGALNDGDGFGRSVTSLGDLDGDSIVDLAVGAHLDDDGGPDRGATWILFLNSNGTVKSHQKISATDGGFAGALNDGDRFGAGVCALGDFDDDGNTELGIGATRDNDGGLDRGALWVLFLDGNGTVKLGQKISDTQGGFGGALKDGDYFGSVSGRIGDLDCDGRQDVAVGAIGDDDGGTARGATWILFLEGNGAVMAEQKISDTQGNFTGSLDDDDNFGTDMTPLGDLNGDDRPDIAVSAEGDDDGGPDRGAVWVLFNNGTGCTVPVFVQAFHASWAMDHVEVVWRLSDDAGDLDFDVFRREEPHGAFRLLSQANVLRRGKDLVLEDRAVEVGRTYRYRVTVREDAGPVASFEVTVSTPGASFALHQNHPNPFNPSTRIDFSLDRAVRATLAVYDVSGRRVQTLVSRELPAGSHSAEWDGRDLQGRPVASGIYLIRLTAGERSLTQKAVLLK